MEMQEKIKRAVRALARHSTVVRLHDFRAHGVHPESVRRMMRAGGLRRVARGTYVFADVAPTEHHTLAQVCRRIPGGVVCLLSALDFHELTTQMPFEVWLAIERRAWKPREPRLPLRIVRFSGAAFESGIEVHEIEGVPVKVYNPAKTVADCFKYRNKFGRDVAIEALRDCTRERRCTYDELWYYAKICRVANVMRPYLEAVS